MKTRRHVMGVVFGVYLVGPGMLAGVMLYRMRFDHRRSEVLARYDHRHWNDVLDFPSVENICELLSRELRERISFPMVIRVWEGNGKWAEM